MKLDATVRYEVDVNPKDVIKKLIQKEIGLESWVLKNGGHLIS